MLAGLPSKALVAAYPPTSVSWLSTKRSVQFVCDIGDAEVLCTVIVRAAGVGSVLPKASVTARVTAYTPAFGKVTAPGFWLVEGGGPPAPKLHAYVSGRLLSGSVPLPLKVT